jgi:conjugative transfer region lipoprotein (TIGR03751 family)
MPILKLHFMTIALCSLMFGCASHHQTLDDRDSGLTMSQIYHHSMDEIAAPVPHYHIKTAANVGYKPMSTDNVLPFKPLENPLVPIYVYPHVALIGDEQILKPGFASAFFLYKQNQFALASEQY